MPTTTANTLANLYDIDGNLAEAVAKAFRAKNVSALEMLAGESTNNDLRLEIHCNHQAETETEEISTKGKCYRRDHELILTVSARVKIEDSANYEEHRRLRGYARARLSYQDGIKFINEYLPFCQVTDIKAIGSDNYTSAGPQDTDELVSDLNFEVTIAILPGAFDALANSDY